MGVMELAERFVGAAERLASAVERIADELKKEEILIEMKPARGMTAAEAQAQAEHAYRDAEKLCREFLKKELREWGIKFKEAASTKTLKSLLEVAQKSGIEKPEPEAEKPAQEEAAAPVAEPEKPVSKDDVKTAMIAMAQKQGKDAALKVLRDIGKSEKLSDVDPALYGALIKACGNGTGVSANG